MLDVDAFLSEEAKAWAEFKGRFDRLPSADFLTPGVVGDWTPKDLLVHVASWHRWMSDKLTDYAGGFAKLETLSAEAIDELNTGFLERFVEWPVEGVIVLSRDAHTRAVVSIRASSFRGYDEEWERVIRSNTTEHYAEHLPHLDAFLKERG